MKRWLLAVSMAANQFINALLGGNPDMSVSARAGYTRNHGAKLGTGICHVLDWIDRRDGDAAAGNHCDIAVWNFEHPDEPR